jgi:hypothetical protein
MDETNGQWAYKFVQKVNKKFVANFSICFVQFHDFIIKQAASVVNFPKFTTEDTKVKPTNIMTISSVD